MKPVRSRNQRGFVITLELILILTILVFGTLVGVIAVRNGLLSLLENKIASTLFVKDGATPPLLIKPISFDLCEAPQFLCPDPDNGLFALLGIRPNRFVSRDRVYFTTTDCTGTAYLATPGDSTLPVGYLNALQGVSYAAGPPDGGSPAGRLYRSTATPAGAVTIQSVWTSLNPDCYLLSNGNDPVVYSSPTPLLCENLVTTASTFSASGRSLLVAEEVLDAGGDNVLEPYTTLFSVMAPVAPTITYTPAVPEGVGPQGPGVPGATTTPGAPLDPDVPAEPEGTPP